MQSSIRILLFIAILNFVKPLPHSLEDNDYEKVPTVHAKFKSRQSAGLAWYQQPLQEGALRTFYDEYGSERSSKRATTTTEKGFFEQVIFGDDDEDEDGDETDDGSDNKGKGLTLLNRQQTKQIEEATISKCVNYCQNRALMHEKNPVFCFDWIVYLRSRKSQFCENKNFM